MMPGRSCLRSAPALVGGGIAAAFLLLAAGAGAPASADAGARMSGEVDAPVSGHHPAATAAVPPVCVPAPEPEPPEYYAFPLVSTGRLPGTGAAGGEGRVNFPSSSPYGVALEPDGSYRYELRISTTRLPQPRSGRYVVWVTTPDLDRIRPVGPLPESGEMQGTVTWNKFLVVVTLEPEDSPVLTDDGDGPSDGEGGGSADAPAASWTGPIVLRGMSRSGSMHTMAGHGPFEQENCAAYGY